MKLKALIILALLMLSYAPMFVTFMPQAEAAVKIDDTSSSTALKINTQHKIIYSGSRWFNFYYNGTHWVFSSSTNGNVWASATAITVMSGNTTTSSGAGVEVYLQGSTVYLAWANNAGKVWFSNGTISGSSITWGNAKLLVNSGPADNMGGVSITRATTGRIWVSSCLTSSPRLYMSRSDDQGVTWASDTTAMFGPACDQWTAGSVISAMDAGRVMLIGHGTGGMIYQPVWYTYSGAAWSGPGYNLVGIAKMPNDAGGFSIVADGVDPDIQYLAWLNSTSKIFLVKYDSGWGSPETIASTADSDSYPTLSYDHVHNRVIASWVKSDVVYARVRNSNGTWDNVEEVEDLSGLNVATPQHLSAAVREWNNKIGMAVVTGSGVPYNVTWITYNIAPAGCTISTVTLLNPEADGWVFADEKFYLFRADYNVDLSNASAADTYQIRMTDGLDREIIASYNITSERYTIEEGNLYANIAPSNRTGYVTYDPVTFILSIQFPIYFLNTIQDKTGVTLLSACGGGYSLDSGSTTFNIYNHGGLVQQTTIGNATFTAGGEWFQGCANDSLGMISANQTWRKLQHMSLMFSLRAYKQSGGEWVGEDQLLQTHGNAGVGEDWLEIAAWNFRVVLYGWDNGTQSWIRLARLTQFERGGDMGATAAWIAPNDYFMDDSGIVSNQTYYGWIQREPKAQHREYLDLWFNKINSSSVAGIRTSPEFFGMLNNGGWLLWSAWAPMQDYPYSAMSYINLKNGTGGQTYAGNYDLMKVGVEFETLISTASVNPWQICIEDVDVNTIKTQDIHQPLFGIDTPPISPPKVPDMGQTGLLAPLISMLTWGFNSIIQGLMGVTGLVWSYLRSNFPWFTNFWESTYSVAIEGSTMLTTLLGYIGGLWKFFSDTFWIVGWTINIVTGTYALIVQYTGPFTANWQLWIELAVIAYVIIPFMDALGRGDTKQVTSDIRNTWLVANRVMDWSFRIISFIIDLIVKAVGAIPGI